MRITDNLTVSLRNLFKRKVRTLLTVIGVTVGTTSIVVMISLGLGMNRSFQESLKNMRDITKIDVYHNSGDKGLKVKDDTIAKVEKLNGVLAVTPVLQTYVNVVVGKRSGSMQIYGIKPEAMEKMGYPVGEGRLLSPDAPWEIVYGSNTPNEIKTAKERADEQRKWRTMYASGGVYYEEEDRSKMTYAFDILEEKVQASVDWNFGQPSIYTDTGSDAATTAAKPPKPYNLVGVGILTGESYEFYYQNYMNIETVKKIMEDRLKFEKAQGARGGNNQSLKDTGYTNLLVKATDINVVEQLVKDLEEIGFSYVSSPITYITEMKKTSQSMQTFLGFIGGVTFVVAAIGIANTMIMSIYERTREIGVMKVIGASLKDIRNLFLTEAAAIGLIGGVFGVAFSYGVAFLFKKAPQILAFLPNFSGEVAIYVPLWLAAVALAFATFVGLLSGYFPARRAMKVSALQAIQSQG